MKRQSASERFGSSNSILEAVNSTGSKSRRRKLSSLLNASYAHYEFVVFGIFYFASVYSPVQCILFTGIRLKQLQCSVLRLELVRESPQSSKSNDSAQSGKGSFEFQKFQIYFLLNERTATSFHFSRREVTGKFAILSARVPLLQQPV